MTEARSRKPEIKIMMQIARSKEQKTRSKKQKQVVKKARSKKQLARCNN
jgi:hypothetical protein